MDLSPKKVLRAILMNFLLLSYKMNFSFVLREYWSEQFGDPSWAIDKASNVFQY